MRIIFFATAFVLSVLFLAASPRLDASSSHDRPGSAGPLSLRCPDGVGPCSWTLADGWRPLADATELRQVQDVWQTSSGATVVLLRGHQDEGTVVVAAGGRIVAARHLSMALGLAMVSAENPDGNIVLCNATRDSEFCDVEVHVAENAPLELRSPALPLDCLVPRFRDEGGVVCFHRDNQGIVVRETDAEGRIADRRFPRQWLPDDAVLLGSTLLLREGQKLFSWNGVTLAELSAEEVLWIQGGPSVGPGKTVARGGSLAESGLAYVAECAVLEATGPRACQLEVVDQNLERRTIWRSDSVVPNALRFLGDGDGLILDVSTAQGRALLHLTFDGDVVREEMVWSRADPA